MVVKEGQKFQFCIIPRRSDNEQDKEDCKQVLAWLEAALSNIGAGAKTAVGYGRFEKIEKNKDEEKAETKVETKAEAWIKETVKKI
jgi:CRISPR-associated protein Cmr6